MTSIKVQFEWDEAKSAANLAKHGIDFPDAIFLWTDPQRLTLPSRDPRESRELVIGSIAGVYWTAIATQRGQRVRIISVRRSRDNEKKLYLQKP